jgi:hypothetical protein
MGHPETGYIIAAWMRGKRPIPEGIGALDASMRGWTLGKAEWGRGKTVFPGKRRETEKEELPGAMKITLPGNSFPQICVVSIGESVERRSAEGRQ